MSDTDQVIASPTGTTIASLIDDTPMNARHYGYWALASGGTFIDGFCVASLGVALPLLKREFTINPTLLGLIGSALVLGSVLGAGVGGLAADRLGRKKAFLLDMLILALGSLLCAFASGPIFVIVGQFVLGIGIGIDFPTSASYTSEILPKAIRSRMTVATIALQSVGMTIAVLVALAILKLNPAWTDWRPLLASGGLLAAVTMCFRLTLPESPRWLMQVGRMPEAFDALARLIGRPVPAAVAAQVNAAQHTPVETTKSSLRRLFSRDFRDRTLLVSLPWLLMDVATYGVGLFTPVILGAMHFGASGHPGTIAAIFAGTEGSGIVDVFLLLGFLTALVAVPRFGRIKMQIAGFAGMTLGMVLLVLAAQATGGPETHIALVIGGFILFNFAMNIGPNATTFTLAAQLFPTSIRASASGFAAASAKFGATIGTFAVPQLQARFGPVGVLCLMALVSLGGLVATTVLADAIRSNDDLAEESAPSRST